MAQHLFYQLSTKPHTHKKIKEKKAAMIAILAAHFTQISQCFPYSMVFRQAGTSELCVCTVT